jgi:hypothetical protein
MKRFLPFIIIAFVGLVTVGVGPWFVGAKTQSPTATAGEKQHRRKKRRTRPFIVRGPRNRSLDSEIYGDFQCPPCATASAIDELQKQYEGKMRVVYPNSARVPTCDGGSDGCGGGWDTGKFWEMHDMLYQYQPVWSRVTNAKFFFESYAESLNLDVARFRADRQAADLRARICGGRLVRPGAKKHADDFHKRNGSESGCYQGKTAGSHRRGARGQERPLTVAATQKDPSMGNSPAEERSSIIFYWILAIIALLWTGGCDLSNCGAA